MTHISDEIKNKLLPYQIEHTNNIIHSIESHIKSTIFFLLYLIQFDLL